MSRIFGAIRQNGYVVEDMGSSLEHWTNRLGVGPFFRFRLEFDYYKFRGVSSWPILDIALANSGDLQIELIQQINDAPSAYKDFLQSHGSGLQHVAVWTEKYLDDIARFGRQGYELDSECKIKDRGRAVFYRTDIHAGALIEVLEMLPVTKNRMELIRLAAVDWNGANPVRSI